MNRFKGPELKLSELKVPPVLRDLYWDLRDRRLLPLIGLVVVAIVATPFLLGGGGKRIEPTPALTEGGSAEEASLTVLPAEPGLREPSKRLAGRPSKNPFRQHFTGPVFNKGAAPSTETSTASGTSSTSSETAPESSAGGGASSPPEATPPPEAPSGGGETGKPHFVFFAFAIDVKIKKTVTEPDGKKSSEEIEKQRVLPPSSLPSEKTQVVTYMGVSPKTRKPLLLVSEDVSSIFGETDCLAGSGRCQLIEVEPKMPVTFLYGENDARYKLEVTNIEVVPTGHS